MFFERASLELNRYPDGGADGVRALHGARTPQWTVLPGGDVRIDLPRGVEVLVHRLGHEPDTSIAPVTWGNSVSATAAADGPIVVAGSLYLVGAVRARLVDDPLLRDPITVAAR